MAWTASTSLARELLKSPEITFALFVVSTWMRTIKKGKLCESVASVLLLSTFSFSSYMVFPGTNTRPFVTEPLCNIPTTVFCLIRFATSILWHEFSSADLRRLARTNNPGRSFRKSVLALNTAFPYFAPLNDIRLLRAHNMLSRFLHYAAITLPKRQARKSYHRLLH
jgi:hypothetical protein